jgi:hypothetical protein
MEKSRLLDVYNAAVKKLQDMQANGSSAALSQRRRFEQDYMLASKALVSAGLLNPVKRKYRTI